LLDIVADCRCCDQNWDFRAEKAWEARQAAADKKLEHKGYRNMQHADTKTALPDIVKILNELQQQENAANSAVRAAAAGEAQATVLSRQR